jgi:glycosyltransferase involved in cell wall biosynthesis
MRIIIVTANLPHGTDEAFIVPEIEEFMRAGHEVLLVPRSPQGPIVHGHSLVQHTRQKPLVSSGILAAAVNVGLESPRRILRAASIVRRSRTVHIAAKNLAVLPKAFWLAAIAREWEAEHIHSHWAGTTATLAMVAAGIAGIPWSFTAHRWDIVEDNLLREKVQSARLARFISEDGLNMAKEIGIEVEPSARVLKMGVALPPAVQRPAGAWPIVVCPARLVEVKGHEFLLDAWRILKDRGVHGELWLAGDGELRMRIESMIRRLGLQNVVRVLGTLPHEELLRIYREKAISAVVLASMDLGNGVHEGIPVGLIEAMGHGIPVVATTTGGTPELVKPGTGFLVPPANARALANAMEMLLRDKGLIDNVGQSARRHVLETHDLSAVVTNLVKCFREGPANAVNGAPAAA